MDEVVLLYSADQWLNCSSMKVIAVCSSMLAAIDLAIEHAKVYHGLISSESISEDEYNEDADYLEDVIDGLHRNGQFNGHEFGYHTETVKMDELQ